MTNILISYILISLPPLCPLCLQIKRYLIGPKSFPLDRLMAIFHSITGGGTKPTPNLYSQVSVCLLVEEGGDRGRGGWRVRRILIELAVPPGDYLIYFQLVSYTHTLSLVN